MSRFPLALRAGLEAVVLIAAFYALFLTLYHIDPTRFQ